jgi:hypothetical protein
MTANHYHYSLQTHSSFFPSFGEGASFVLGNDVLLLGLGLSLRLCAESESLLLGLYGASVASYRSRARRKRRRRVSARSAEMEERDERANEPER